LNLLEIKLRSIAMADKDKAEKPKDKVDLGLLEEDDEFEEFPAEGEVMPAIAYFLYFHRIGFLYLFQIGLLLRTMRN
jgi:hypothetical protein